MKHKHAELMAQYAQDAMDTDEPWLRWEFYSKTFGGWIDCHVVAPSWYEQTEYRRKPQTRTITIPETIVFRAGRNISMKPRTQEISLRDYLASNAMQGMMSYDSTRSDKIISQYAYSLADEMLKAREVKP